MALTGMLLALSLAPLAVVHASSLIGFFAVAAMYVACGFVMGPFFELFYIGFRDFDAVMRCLLVSAAIVVTFAALATKDLVVGLSLSKVVGALFFLFFCVVIVDMCLDLG